MAPLARGARLVPAVAWVLFLSVTAASCSDGATCGEGTLRQGDECVAADDGAGARAMADSGEGVAAVAADGGSTGKPGASGCSPGTQSTPGRADDPCADMPCSAVAVCGADGRWGECVCAPGSMSTCGNGIVEPGERCDGTDLRGWSCARLIGSQGILSCEAGCRDFDYSTCDQSRRAVNNCPAPSECRLNGSFSNCVEPDTGQAPLCSTDTLDPCPYGLCAYGSAMPRCGLACTVQ